jgi:TctA family transporter
MGRKFVLTAFAYAMLGMLFGIYMGVSRDFSQMDTHTHILLIGFAVSLAYALCHTLWLSNAGKLAVVQFYVHLAATFVLLVGLFLFYGGMVGATVIGPVLGIGSIAVFIGMVLMFFMLVRYPAKA